MNNFVIEDELKKIPKKPGVYLMHDEKDVIIYVGKAKNLYNRVHSYFNNTNKSIKTEHMVHHINWFEYILTDNEQEALALECNLIKENNPKYNIMLMDDKEYPYIKVTTSEKFPRIVLSRKIEKDHNKNKYYGPFVTNTSVKDIIELLQKLYKIRDCNRKVPFTNKNERACLNYHLGNCSAPCINAIDIEKYNENVKEAIYFLEGKYEKVIHILNEKMEKASKSLDYESAYKYKVLLDSISRINDKQKITETDLKNRDIIGMSRNNKSCVVEIFFIRKGKMIGRDNYYIKIDENDKDEIIIEEFLKQFYYNSPYIPYEIFVPYEIEDKKLLEDYLSKINKSSVHIVTPKIGKKQRLVNLASNNAKLILEKDENMLENQKKKTIKAVEEIEKLLGISKIKRIEAYDISNISGENQVGSMIVFENGIKKTSDYRKFNIKCVVGPDDYKALKEVLKRRFDRYKNEINENNKTSFAYLPDLIMMDGGKGQVKIAEEVLNEYKIRVNVCGLVKDDRHRTRGIYYNSIEHKLDNHSEGFKLVTRIQDEAHRFAISLHRSKRSKEQTHSILDDITGIGPVRRKNLRKHFITIENIKNASIEELMQVESITKDSAKNIYIFFHNDAKN